MSSDIRQALGKDAEGISSERLEQLDSYYQRGLALASKGDETSVIAALECCPFFLLAPSFGLVRSERREDYPHLDDAAYANFRNVATTGMGPGILYRSSSPFWERVNRDWAVDEAARKAAIRTILDVADDMEDLLPRLEEIDSYCAGLDIFARRANMFFCDPAQEQLFAELIRFLIAHEGPYLLHCFEGQDRTGYMCAVLECFMGAGLDEILDDYLTTYRNYYDLEDGSLPCRALSTFFLNQLRDAFRVEDIRTCDLQESARAFLSRIGLDRDEQDALRAALSQPESA